MAKQRKVSRIESSRARGRSADESSPAISVQGIEIPSELNEAIEVERDNLSRAESLLGCLARSMESDCEMEPGTRPYYPDIAHMARQMVRNSINGLDSLSLQQSVQRNKVKDDGWRDLATARYH